MIIYNVTVNIDNDVRDEWLKWMKEVHIPNVMKTGFFTESRMLRLIGDEESGGTTYAIQYTCETMRDFELYRDGFSPALKQEASDKFGEKFTAFRTLLETV
jgi:hypothetical protein